jgi:D-glycero-alpha-D-manno-heptose-7-phosphate kinase
MIISRTPYRISFLGGGTDYPSWYEKHGGAVLGTTIDKYCYIFVRKLPPFFSHKHRVVYSQIELVRDHRELVHPAVRAALMEFTSECPDGIEIQHMGDLPARSGLGSSSSFTVGLLNALNALRGRMTTPSELASEAIRIEQHVIKESVGSQDQVWAALGGLGCITFHPTGKFELTPLIISNERIKALNDCIMLFYSGQSRFASAVAAEKIENLAKREGQLLRMRELVDEGVKILQQPNRSLDDLGRLLHESWRLKKELAASVTNSGIDEIYEAGLSGGAVGGKLLGAGGGGFVLLFARPECHEAIRQRLKGLIEVRAKIDSSGSTIVLYAPDR